MEGSKLNIGNIMKVAIYVVLIALQMFILWLAISSVYDYMKYAFWIIELIGIITVLHIVYKKETTSIKLSWVLFILLLPVCGLMFYLLWGRLHISKKTSNALNTAKANNETYLKQDHWVMDDLDAQNDLQVRKQVDIIFNTSKFPVYKNTRLEYYPLGEDMFEGIKEELLKAKRFIYVEYFIISKGRMADEFLQILFDKADEGLDVRIMYDEVGSFRITPPNLKQNCAKHGIPCMSFNPLSASIYKYLNYRDHRKILDIDGNTCFTGGINIGDEYVNDYEKHGHWKDIGIMLKGDAVWSFTVMFLNMWDFLNATTSDYLSCRPTVNYLEEKSFVLPFGDGPTNGANPSMHNYLKIITTAQRYVYIETPYLIIDTEMTSALTLAAKSGVDVRIITPHIPDKAFVHATTRSFYGELISEGVKVFEYTPGFIHAKSIISDDKVCYIGSVNFDYRSLIWNYECGVWVYNDDVVFVLRDDFLDTQNISQEITYDEWKKQGVLRNLKRAFLRIISPLI